MSGKTIAFGNNFLRLLFNAVTWPNIADNTAGAPLTSLFVSLHTSDPGISGSQTTNEVVYTGYARVAVSRTVGGWTVAGNVVTPVSNIDFPACSGGAATATF